MVPEGVPEAEIISDILTLFAMGRYPCVWQRYILSTLINMHLLSKCRFAVILAKSALFVSGKDYLPVTDEVKSSCIPGTAETIFSQTGIGR